MFVQLSLFHQRTQISNLTCSSDISTAYVDRLHSAGAPQFHSHSHSHGSDPDAYIEAFGHSHSQSHAAHDNIDHAFPCLTPTKDTSALPTPALAPAPAATTQAPSASTPLMHNGRTPVSYNALPTRTPAGSTTNRPQALLQNAHQHSSYFTGHHRHESRDNHHEHGRPLPRATPSVLSSLKVQTAQRQQSRTRQARSPVREVHGEEEQVGHGDEDDTLRELEHGHSHGHGGEDAHEQLDKTLSRKRQVVSILVGIRRSPETNRNRRLTVPLRSSNLVSCCIHS
jgi:hypothetical protein